MRRVTRRGLAESSTPLCEHFDVALLDLDGVVYLGTDAVAGAPEALLTARERGLRLAFVTNNAARPAHVVAAHLTRLGVPAEPDEVITSAHAAARYLAERLPPAARVLVVGTVGLVEALAERGLVPVASAEDDPVAVVQGYSPQLDWAQLAEGAVAIRRGLLWVATNLDPTVPSPRGPLPGNGSLVAALQHATGAHPVVTGKPDPAMHREMVLRSDARRPLVVGDRLDTDVEGANTAQCPSLLVLSGVTTPVALLAAPPAQRPDFLGRDVSALLTSHPATTHDGTGFRCGRWSARPTRESAANGITLAACGAPGERSPDGLDPLRVLCAAAWADRPHAGQPECEAADDEAMQALVRFELA